MGLFSIFKRKNKKEQDLHPSPERAYNSEKTQSLKNDTDKEHTKTENIRKSAPQKPEAEVVKAEKATKPSTSGKFEIKKSKDNRYVFNLYASNNVIVATSQIYSSAASAQNGIKSVIENAPRAAIEDQTLKNYESLPYPKWEIYVDKGKQFRFRLSASNGSCICHSQGYTAKNNCKKGIESIIKTVKNAKIDKSYLKKD